MNPVFAIMLCVGPYILLKQELCSLFFISSLHEFQFSPPLALLAHL